MTVRRWMLVVALIALALLPAELLRQRYVYLKRAESCERRVEGGSIRRKQDDKFGIFRPEMFDADGNMNAIYERAFDIMRDYYARLGRKYRHAAAHPWQTVEPDPPIPGQ